MLRGLEGKKGSGVPNTVKRMGSHWTKILDNLRGAIKAFEEKRNVEKGLVEGKVKSL